MYSCHLFLISSASVRSIPFLSFIPSNSFLPSTLTLKIREKAGLRAIDFPGGSDGKVSDYSAGDPGSIPGLGRSSGEGNGNPLQYSGLENPMDGEVW